MQTNEVLASEDSISQLNPDIRKKITHVQTQFSYQSNSGQSRSKSTKAAGKGFATNLKCY